MPGKRAEYFYEFGHFRIDPAERLLLREGRIVPLTPKTFDALLLLVENSGHVLEKNDIIESLWPDSFVEESSLTKNVSLLRKALGEGVIETLPKRGYRFVAEVRQVPNVSVELTLRRRTRTRTVTFEEESADALDADSSHVALQATGAEVRSVAVLPFATLGLKTGDEYLGLGLADALITQLCNTGQIVVRPTSAVRKYADAQQDSASVGRELNVDAVLEGSIQRADERLRVTVQMVESAGGAPLWADKFNVQFTDIFAVQDSISEQVARSLTHRLSGENRGRLMKRYTESVEAYQAYLKGRFFWNKRTVEGIQKSIGYFKQAIEIDAAYALAYVGLADGYNVLPAYAELPTKDYLPHGQAAALKALEIDDTLAEAHASLGWSRVNHDWNWIESEAEHLRAIELNPNYATAHHWYGMMLWTLARFDEAIAEIKRAQKLDPLSLGISVGLGIAYHIARDYDHAIEQHRKILEIEPGFAVAHFYLGMAFMQKGMYEESLDEYKRAEELEGEATPLVLASRGATYAMAGRRADALRTLDAMHAMARKRYVAPYDLALVYANLGDADEAMRCLERCYDEHNVSLTYLKVDPGFDPLRTDARFADLLRRIGLAVL